MTEALFMRVLACVLLLLTVVGCSEDSTKPNGPLPVECGA